MTDRSQIEEIKDKLDIVQVAEGYLRAPMRKSGRNVFTLCPFHSEKSPSFSLNSDLGMYKCFGCGEAGDVITLIEKMEGIDFPRAVEVAAQRAGVTLKSGFEKSINDKYSKEKARILEANLLSAKYFNHILNNDKSAEFARDYVKSRKMRKEEVELYQIGFAPNGFENLKNFLTKRGFTLKELVTWGLQVEKNGRIYDKFRNRLIFPIFSVKGEVIGFSGRTLEKDGIPKYLNSPETIVYKKSSVLYGLFQARDSVRQKNFAIIAEGNVEPMSSRKAGIENVVAPMGTSLTLNQLNMLKKYCDTLYFAFDTDGAGKAALLRAVRLAYPLGFKIKAIDFSPFKDPDEMISESMHKWVQAVAHAQEITSFMIQRYKREYDLSQAQGKSDFLKAIAPFINSLSDPIEFDHYIKELSSTMNVENSVILSSLKGKTEDFSVVERESEKHDVFVNKIKSKEEYLIALILNFPEYKLEKDDIRLEEPLEKIFDLYSTYNSLKKTRESLEESEKDIFDRINVIEVPADISKDQVLKMFENLKHEIIKEQSQYNLEVITKKIKEYELKGESIEDLINEQADILNKLRKYNLAR